MTLDQTLVALSKNNNMNISILDADDNILITFNATGYGGVENTITEAHVKYIKIKSINLIEISTDYAVTP